MKQHSQEDNESTTFAQTRPDPPGAKDIDAITTPLALRAVLIAAGTVSLVLGLIGAFLPIVPTTPFLLLSAACFARSSSRLHRGLLNSRWCGPALRRWRETRTISRTVKTTALSLIVLWFTLSCVFFVEANSHRIVLASIGAVLFVFLLRVPTSRP